MTENSFLVEANLKLIKSKELLNSVEGEGNTTPGEETKASDITWDFEKQGEDVQSGAGL